VNRERAGHVGPLVGFVNRPWVIALCVFAVLLILSCLACDGFKRYELVSILLNVATLETLIVTAIYIFRYWKETERTNALSLKNMAYSRLPILDFKVEAENRDSQAGDYSERIFLVNKGYGPAFDVSLWKIPLPDNAQKRAVTGKSGPNNPVQKSYNVVGPGESILFYREPNYPAKEIQITVRFKNMFNQWFEWEYKGSPQRLDLSHWHIDVATEKLLTPRA
jgi:hypothetical protein